MREWNIEGWVVNFYLDNVMIQPSLFHPLIVYLFRPIFVCVHLMKLSLLTQNCLLMLVTDCYLSLLIILFCLFVFLSDSKLPIQIALLMHLTIQCTSYPTVQERYPDSGTHCIKEVKIRCERNKNEITLRVLQEESNSKGLSRLEIDDLRPLGDLLFS